LTQSHGVRPSLERHAGPLGVRGFGDEQDARSIQYVKNLGLAIVRLGTALVQYAILKHGTKVLSEFFQHCGAFF
jgi:hypothetical protein